MLIEGALWVCVIPVRPVSTVIGVEISHGLTNQLTARGGFSIMRLLFFSMEFQHLSTQVKFEY